MLHLPTELTEVDLEVMYVSGGVVHVCCQVTVGFPRYSF
jgi:hypothetical protein